MILFVVLGAVLLAVALLLVLPPLLGWPHRAAGAGGPQLQEHAVRAVLREQLAEINAARDAGTITEEDHRRSSEELERRVLEEGRAAAGTADERPAPRLAVCMALGIPLGALMVYLWLGSPGALSPLGSGKHPFHSTVERPTEDLIAGLAKRLGGRPDDPAGWRMLARSYGALGEFDQARETWERIGASAPRHAGVLADWAEILAFAQGGRFAGEPERLLGEALELAPTHIKALALAGRAAFLRGDFASAADHWQRLLDQVPPSDPGFEAILESVSRARAGAGLEPIGARQAATGDVGAPGSASGERLQLRGTVLLDPGLAPTVNPDDSVFVYARPVEGGMPLAVLRYSASELPAAFDFRQGLLMSEADLPAQLAVVARLSRSGDPQPRAGDLEGISMPLSKDASNVRVVIDRIRE